MANHAITHTFRGVLYIPTAWVSLCLFTTKAVEGLELRNRQKPDTPLFFCSQVNNNLISSILGVWRTYISVMSIIKQAIKPVYYAIRSTCLYRSFNLFQNLFFRHNNLLWALIVSKFKGNQIILGNNIVFRYCKFEIHGTGNCISIKDNCKLSGLRIYMNSGKNRLVIGKNTIVNASKDQRTLFNPCEGGEILIGDNCLFSNNIEIHTTDYHKIFINKRRENVPQNIVIGSHCWIGLQCLILKGTILADNSIVGAKSLLNKKYNESNTVIVGNPARIVKTNITWDF